MYPHFSDAYLHRLRVYVRLFPYVYGTKVGNILDSYKYYRKNSAFCLWYVAAWMIY